MPMPIAMIMKPKKIIPVTSGNVVRLSLYSLEIPFAGEYSNMPLVWFVVGDITITVKATSVFDSENGIYNINIGLEAVRGGTIQTTLLSWNYGDDWGYSGNYMSTLNIEVKIGTSGGIKFSKSDIMGPGSNSVSLDTSYLAGSQTYISNIFAPSNPSLYYIIGEIGMDYRNGYISESGIGTIVWSTMINDNFTQQLLYDLYLDTNTWYTYNTMLMESATYDDIGGVKIHGGTPGMYVLEQKNKFTLF